MRNPLTEDQPRPVRYSFWFLLFLFGHMLLSHLDRTVSELARVADPGLLDIFRAITEAGTANGRWCRQACSGWDRSPRDGSS